LVFEQIKLPTEEDWIMTGSRLELLSGYARYFCQIGHLN